MNRLTKHFDNLKKDKQKAAIFFITAGDPNLHETFHIMESMALAGADCIEIGIPFSDPIADGPVIQRAAMRALTQKITIKNIMQTVKKFRLQWSTSVVLMGYYNPILRYGLRDFFCDCASFGVDGVIIADLPFEEGQEAEEYSKAYDVHLIYLLAPDIDSQRTERILKSSSGFVHCVAQYSITGSNSNQDESLPATIKSLQRMTSLPVVVGFGISSLDKVRLVSETADGVIIGSWLIRELEEAQNKNLKAGEFVCAVKQAMER